MKKVFLFFMVVFLAVSGVTYGQKNKKNTEVLYFKANLACCRARACNTLQADVESVLKKYFENENIDFKVIRLADETNKDIVTKYNAKSQTVIIVMRKRKKETSFDLSSIVQDYAKNRNREKFENELKDRISELL